MTIEDRIREALRADAQRIEPPPTPPLERLTSRERMGAVPNGMPPPDRDPLEVFTEERRRARSRRLQVSVGVASAIVAAAVLWVVFVPVFGGPGPVEITGTPDEHHGTAAVAWRQLGHAPGKIPGAAAATVVSDIEELDAMWERYEFDQPLPMVDFAHAVVLLLGQFDDPCPDDLLHLDVERAEDDAGVLRTEWNSPSCVLSASHGIYAVEVHRGLLPQRLQVEGGDQDELRPVVLSLPPYEGPAPPPHEPSAPEVDLDAIFADHPVQPCVRGENGRPDRAESGGRADDAEATRSVVEAAKDLSDHRRELDEQMRIVGTQRWLEVVEIVVEDLTREALDAIAEVTDPRRVCITVLPQH